MPRTRLIPLLCLALASCSERTTAPQSAQSLPTLPTSLRLEAFAAGTEGGINASCHIDYVIDAVRNGAYYDVTGGGEAMRSVLDQTGAGVQFWADAGFIGRLQSTTNDGIALVTYLNGEPFKPTGESPFWDEILSFHGRLATASDGVVASGEWTCRPMGVRDDTFATVTGSWTLRAR